MVSDPSPIFRRKACQDPIAESITQFGLFLHTAISPLLTEIDWTGCSLETNARKSVRLHSFAIGNRNSKVADSRSSTDRTEVPKGKTAFSHSCAHVTRCPQVAPFKC